jgi:hypothetical protein
VAIVEECSRHIESLRREADAVRQDDTLSKQLAGMTVDGRRGLLADQSPEKALQTLVDGIVLVSIFERLQAPRSGLGTGWRSRMCTDIPMVFHAMPQSLRLRVVERHLGPAPCWFVRDSVVDRFPIHLGATLISASAQGRKVSFALSQEGQQDRQVEVDHVIAATGYKVSISRLGFLGKDIQTRIAKVADTPILNRRFESSVPGLYFIGAAAANSFGPLLRFAFGAKFAAKRVSRHLMAT